MFVSRKFGSGKTLRSAWPLASILLVGTLLSGNGRLLTGSLTAISLPLRSSDCEKSPARSRAVGTVTWPMPPFRLVGTDSRRQKKEQLPGAAIDFPGDVNGPADVVVPRVEAVARFG